MRIEPVRSSEPVFSSAVTEMEPLPLPEVLSRWNQVADGVAVQSPVVLTAIIFVPVAFGAKVTVVGVAERVTFTSGVSLLSPPQELNTAIVAATAIIYFNIFFIYSFFIPRFWGSGKGTDGPETVAARGHREREGPSRQAGRDRAEGP